MRKSSQRGMVVVVRGAASVCVLKSFSEGEREKFFREEEEECRG